LDKPTVQERVKEAEATEPRKLNMEEKRKLEKLLIGDIDSATERFGTVTRTEREALIERLERTPIAGAKALYERYKLVVKQREELEKKICTLGYNIRYDGKLRGSSWPASLCGFRPPPLSPIPFTRLGAQQPIRRRRIS
jgi:hypothetical protein